MSKKFQSKAVLASILALSLAMPMGAMAAEDDSAAEATATSAKIEEAEKPEEKYYVMISLDRNTLGMQPGDSATIGISIKAPASKDTSVVWSSSDPTIASVDQEGRVKAIKTGDCKIYATVGSVQAAAGVSVTLSRLSYDNAATSSTKSGYTSKSEVEAAVKAGEVRSLMTLAGEWNNVTSDDVSKILVKELKEEGASEITGQFSSDFSAIKIEDGKLTFTGVAAAPSEDGESSQSSDEPVAYEYVAVEVIKNEEGGVANVYKAVSEDAPYQYLMVSNPVLSKSGKTVGLYLSYSNDLAAIQSSGDWATLVVKADLKDADIISLFTEFKKAAKPVVEGVVATAAEGEGDSADEYGAEEVSGDDADTE